MTLLKISRANRHTSLVIAAIAAAALSGCAKSVDHYLENKDARSQMLWKCLMDGDKMESGDCGNAKQAQTKIDTAERARLAEEARARQVRRAAEEAEAARLAAEKRAVEEAQAAADAAKFKAIEAEERKKFDTREETVSSLTPQALAKILVDMATAINRGDTAKAAEAIHVPTAQLGELQAGASRYGGITNVVVKSFNATRPRFNFILQRPTNLMSTSAQSPTGYRVDAEHTQITVEFEGRMSRARACELYGKLKLVVDASTGELQGDVTAFVTTSNSGYQRCRE